MAAWDCTQTAIGQTPPSRSGAEAAEARATGAGALLLLLTLASAYIAGLHGSARAEKQPGATGEAA